MALPENIFKTPKRHSRPQSAISGNRPSSSASSRGNAINYQPRHSTSIMPLSKSIKQSVPNRAFDMPIPLTSRSDIENDVNFSQDLKISIPNSSITIHEGSLNTSFSEFLSVSQRIPNDDILLKGFELERKIEAAKVIQKFFRRYVVDHKNIEKER